MPNGDGTLMSALSELAAPETERDREQPAALRDRLDAARRRVLAVGEAKRGKITLINTLPIYWARNPVSASRRFAAASGPGFGPGLGARARGGYHRSFGQMLLNFCGYGGPPNRPAQPARPAPCRSCQPGSVNGAEGPAVKRSHANGPCRMTGKGHARA